MEGNRSITQIPAIVSLSVFLFVFLVTFCLSYDILTRVSRRQKSDQEINDTSIYEDEDGKATVDSQKQHSAALPTYTVLGGSLVGLLVSLYLSIHNTVTSDQDDVNPLWLIFGSWFLLLVISIYVVIQPKSLTRYRYGLLSALTSAAICISCCFQLQNVLLRSLGNFPVMMAAVQITAAATAGIASLSIPRRPSVEVDGHAVDRQYTVSAFKLYGMAWASDVLSLARTKDNLSLDDLPILHHRARSAHLLVWFGMEAKNHSLWKALLYMHWPEILFETVFAILQAVIHFAPQLVMYNLLRLLEQGAGGGQISAMACILVLGLGFSLVSASWADIWLAWIAHANLGLPIRSELSALIFTKATRRKNVQSSQRSEPIKETDGTTVSEYTQNDIAIGPTTTAPQSTSAILNEDLEKTCQSTINLVSVDAKRVSDFLRYHYIFIQVAGDLVVSIIFLYQLLGWESLLAGFAIFLLVLPLNIWISKNYSDAQGNLMNIRDRKMSIITEALQGIRQIKFSAQETQWQMRIRNVRGLELAMQWRVFWLDTLLIFCWILGPILLSAISLAVYAALHGDLSASVAFTSITIFSALEFSLAIVPEVAADGLEAWVSAARIEEHLGAPELKDYITPHHTIVFENATIAWPSDTAEEESDRFTLQGLNVKIPGKGLTVIGGQTGSGKSLMLASILGEADLLRGAIKRPIPPSLSERYDSKANKTDWILKSSVAFVAQIPWIENATIRENILFGLPYDAGRYNRVVNCCALKKDLDVLPDGDHTDIGFNGINLSGGQRWRVTFARALYSRAGILVLDDIFSAVDAHVGRQLFEEALTGELGQDRTRILVTHHVALCLPKADYVILVAEGTVQQAGSPTELRRMGVLDQIVNQPTKTHAISAKAETAMESASEEDLMYKVLSASSQTSYLIDEGKAVVMAKSQTNKFVEDEKKEKGSIKLSIYRDYLTTSGGIWYWLPILFLFIGHQGLVLGRSWFISIWTHSYKNENAAYYLFVQRYVKFPENVSVDSKNADLGFYLGIYLGLSVILCITGTFKYFFVYTRSIRASKELFEKMTFAILRATLRWLDTVPVGRILNRFTADFEAIDSKLGGDLGALLYDVVQVVGIIMAGVFVSPWTIVMAFSLVVLCVWITKYYLMGARELKRLESIAKSPIFEQFGSTLTGIGTIRAFDKTETYIDRIFQKIDAHARALWHLRLFNQWLAFRLNLVGAVFATAIGAIVAFADIDPSLAGFALGFALQYSDAIVWATRYYANVELSMNAVERVAEYSKIPIEKQSGRMDAPAAWPMEGRLEVSDLIVGYAPESPPVLKGLSFRVEKNTRVGVVGRTGAGKSSLTLALFRFLEAREGSILIDGINIANISLHVLRSRLAIIPQDPVLFSGTVRSNLDPFDEHTDHELSDALIRVHLSRSTERLSRDEVADSSNSDNPAASTNASITLNTAISESGLNLSQGQRQLLCLARAIVRRPKILVLDEATSAVDMTTDLLIQQSIRKEFEDSTLLVIAHRLSTIADFDKILVMEEGKGVEFGSPKELYENNNGVFRGMVEQSGEKTALIDIIESGMQ